MFQDFHEVIGVNAVTVGLSRGAAGESISCELLIPPDAPDIGLFGGTYSCGLVIFGGREPPSASDYDGGTFELRRTD